MKTIKSRFLNLSFKKPLNAVVLTVLIAFLPQLSFASTCKTHFKPIKRKSAKLYEGCGNGKKYSAQVWTVLPMCDRMKSPVRDMEVFCELPYAGSFDTCVADESLFTRICSGRSKLPPPNQKITPVDGWGEPKKTAR